MSENYAGAGGAPSFASEPGFGEEANRRYRQQFLSDGPMPQSVMPDELPFPEPAISPPPPASPPEPMAPSSFAKDVVRSAVKAFPRATLTDEELAQYAIRALPRVTPTDEELAQFDAPTLNDRLGSILKQEAEKLRPIDVPGMAATGARVIGGTASMFGAQTVPRAIEQGANEKARVDQRIRASTVATFRESGLPSFMSPQYGIYPADYGNIVSDALATGKITDRQAATALANFDKFKQNTTLGVAYGKEEFLAEQEAQRLENNARRQGFTEEAIAKTNQAYDVAEQKLAESKQQYEQRRAEFEADLQKRRSEMDALDSEIRATKIEPMSYFSKDNVWAGILSTLSVAVGAFAQGMSGGRVPNTALQIMNATIERDLEAQKANLAAKGKALDYKRSLYGMAREALGDERQAFEYSKGLMYEQLQNAATKIANEARGKEAQLGAMEIANAAGAAKEQARLNTQAMYVQTREAAEDLARRQQAAQYAWVAGKEEREFKRRERLATVQEKEAKAQLARSEAGDELEGGWSVAKKGAAEKYSGSLFTSYDSEGNQQSRSPGFMLATTPETAAKTRAQLSGIDELIGVLRDSAKLPDIGLAGKAQLLASGTPYISPSDSDTYRRLKSEFAIKLKEAAGLGALDKGVIDIAATAGPFESADNKKVAKQIIQQLVSNRDRIVNSVAGTPGQLSNVGNTTVVRLAAPNENQSGGVSFTPKPSK